jgi:hypothetical protein
MRKTLSQRADHPDEKMLLLLLDGEPHRDARPIRIHLQRCRKCQTKMQTLQAGLYAFAEYGQAAFLPAAGAAPKGWSEFPALLDRM